MGAVLGPAWYEDVLACRGPCLDLVKDLSCQHGMAWHDVPKVPGSLSPTRHKSREGQAGLARLGSDAPMQVPLQHLDTTISVILYRPCLVFFLEVPEQTLTVN